MTRQTMINLPQDLEKARQRFERWRQTRRTRSPIPQPLWAAAVKMARRYGINATARALQVNYYSLKERTENGACSGHEGREDGASSFLELAAPATSSTCECILELEDVAGGKMRVQVKGVDVPELAALARSFWGAEA